jgi:autotransporter-associated beta strand protein
MAMMLSPNASADTGTSVTTGDGTIDSGVTGGITQNGSGGTLILTGTNSYTGATILNSGTLAVNAGATMGANTASLIIGSGTTTTGVGSGASEGAVRSQKLDQYAVLYFATHDIHVPRVPHARFAGSTSLGPRGDVIQELDWSVGQILATLDRLKLAENTLVLFSSDNGPVLDDGYADDAVERLGSHKPAGPYRGGKYSIYEGGTRVPFLARWPARIKPAVSPALISQLDLVASFAELTGQKLTADAAPDSMNVLPALLGESQQGRESLVEHANGLAIRRGNWKLIAAPAAGKKGGKADTAKAPASAELFDLSTDLGETTNVIAKHPATSSELTALLQKIREGGRSRP